MKILNTEQVFALLFKDEPHGKRKAQRRLQSLYKRKKLARGRDMPRVPYYYYIGKKPGQIDHRLGVNWVYCWFLSRLKQWEELTFDMEPLDYGFMRPDAFVTVKNKVQNTYTFYFIEMDIAESGNEFNKAALYNRLFDEINKGRSYWWVEHTKTFPAVIIATTGQPEALKSKIEAQNRSELVFDVYSLNKIKEDVEIV